MHKPVKKTRIAQRTMLALASLTLVALPAVTQAAGLGKIAVFSALGEPLKAEIEVLASADEAQSIQTRLATAEAFRQANIDYVPALTALRFSALKERDGQRYIQVTSDRPLNEPFVDMLVELNWAAGRLVREYTFLLDPPAANTQANASVAPVFVASPTASPAATASMVAATAPAATAENKSSARATKPSATTKSSGIAKAPAEGKADGAGQRRYTVASGDTLGKIAARNLPAGVTLEQMLVALFRGNESAFAGGNMNRLRAGKILLIPDAGMATDISVGEARKEVVAQATDFTAYRQKLAAVAASAAVAPEVARQTASGKIAPRVEEPAPSAAGKDKLEVSRTATAKDDKTQGRVAALEEDLVARDKAIKEANQRSAELEKQLADMKKLVELKNKAGSELQQQAQAGKPAGAAVAPAPAKAADKSVDQGKTSDADKKTDQQKENAPAAVAPAAVAESKPAGIAKPAENAPPPKPKKKIVLPPPEPEPSFIEENGALVFGGGGILALLLGWFGFKTWKKRQTAVDDEAIEPEFSVHSSLSTPANSAVPPSEQQASRFSDTVVPPPIDVLAEADTFLAFGRDAQAEEVLRAALETQPERHAIYLKLLDIYAARKNRQDFEAIAKRLHGLTDGQGEDWERAATMGSALDAENPLYRLPSAVETAASAEFAEFAESAEFAKATNVTAESAPMTETSAMPEPPSSTIDFDLTPAAVEPVPETEPAPEPVTAATVDTNVLDFDLDLGEPDIATETAPAPVDLPLSAIDHETAATDGAAKDAHSLDFDFDLELDKSADATPSLDLGGLDLNLDAPASTSADAVSPAPTFDVTGGDHSSEVATKLELAAAYEEMGDHEGARELYQEALAEGSPAQQETARSKLAALG